MQGELNFYYGPMGCGKTRELLKILHSKKEDGFYVGLLKPKVDKKGEDHIVSRDNNRYKVDFLVDKEDNIYMEVCKYLIDNNLDFLLVDEAQFLSTKQVDELSDIVDILNITVICYGLKADFKGELFEGSKRLIEISDNLIEIERQCSCGRKKIYNMRLENNIPVFDGNQIMIDGVEATYEAKCRNCYKKLKKKYNK
ncbi:MAG: thymidine kinase [Bacilli bacterium]|nr:thymidine kinase [Bacilli bacterium]